MGPISFVEMRLQREGVTVRGRRALPILYGGGVCGFDPWALGPFELSVYWWLGREWYFL